MLKKTTFILLLIVSFIAKADEGMWMPQFIEQKIAEMQKMGLKLSSQDIYNINNSSLKDAIIQFGNGCTGEIVSASGLVFTNHHCGYGAIQSQSSVENDYLTYGFWAKRHSEELPIEGLTARFLDKIQDVTKEILEGVAPSMSEKERNLAIRENLKKTRDRYNPDGKFEVRIVPFFEGNEYYMFLYKLYKDVRLVGAPPSSIGKFGADTDNWMWPRHTGDFAIFRVYADNNNDPAEYSASNIPYKAKKYLPISIKPRYENEFAFIMGYPGSTSRYATSQTLQWAIEKRDPMTVKIRTKKLDVLKKYMNEKDDVRIKYASKYASSANYWKYYIGEIRGLNKLGVVKRKNNLENQLINWASKNNSLKEEYSKIFSDIDNAYIGINKYETGIRYNFEAIFRGCEIIMFSNNFVSLVDELKKENPDKEKIASIQNTLIEDVEKYFKDYDLATDQALMEAMLEIYSQDVPKDQQPEYFIKLLKKNGGNFKKLAARTFDKTIFANKEKALEVIKNPKLKQIQKDPVWILQTAFYENHLKLIDQTREDRDALYKNNRLFVKALRQMNVQNTYYPDANSTMRITYGSVLPYSPSDAIKFDFVTTLDGVMAKEDPTKSEFVVMPKLKELYNKKDYGQYGENGKMTVCFLTNNDITGGNSGSPVLNDNGDLIGLAFDGNWEAMSGNFAFEPNLQRCINVDIRYVLFIIDKYAGAKNIIDELEIRK